MDIYTILFTIYFKYVTHLILFRKRLTVIYFNVINSTRHLVEKKNNFQSLGISKECSRGCVYRLNKPFYLVFHYPKL